MYNIGVDLGGTNIAVGIVDSDGNIIEKDSAPTLRDRGHKAIISDIGKICKTIIEKSKLKRNEISSIGIGSPGRCNLKTGIISFANNIDFDNTPIAKMVSDDTGIPTFIGNDADCAALAEAIFGAAKGCENSVTVTLGTGIGTGIIIGKKIYNGSNGGGGEMGHHVIVVDGKSCTCGRKGCWEAYASATGLISATVEAVSKHPKSLINKLINSDTTLINAKITFTAAEEGDATALQVVENYYKYLSEGIANIINILDPEVIVFGGGISAQGDKLLSSVEKYVKKAVYAGLLNSRFEIAKLGNDAGIIGAALLERTK